jgi:cell division protein FtsI/penicillin-binding protein 2
MGRRIRWLGLILVISLSLVVVQLVNIQFVKGPALRASASNPRNQGKALNNQRGSIFAAVKTGTAQTGNPKANTDDWMIGFAPANNPKIAVAVVVPYQNFVDTGARVAGPIMKAMLTAAAALPSGN